MHRILGDFLLKWAVCFLFFKKDVFLNTSNGSISYKAKSGFRYQPEKAEKALYTVRLSSGCFLPVDRSRANGRHCNMLSESLRSRRNPIIPLRSERIKTAFYWTFLSYLFYMGASVWLKCPIWIHGCQNVIFSGVFSFLVCFLIPPFHLFGCIFLLRPCTNQREIDKCLLNHVFNFR